MGIVFSILYVLLFGYHIISTVVQNKEKQFCTKMNTSKFSVLLSFMLFIVGLTGNAALTYEIIKIPTGTFCDILIHAPSLYILFKSIMYLTLAIRVWTFIQTASIFQLTERKLKIWIVIVSSWSVTNLILFNIFTKAGEHCRRIYQEPILVSTVLLDFVAITFSTYLFTKPLYTLYKTSKSLSKVEDKTDNYLYLKKIAMKQWILSIIAVGSSMLSLIGVLLYGLPQLFGTFDYLISTLSIIGMYEWNVWMTSCECSLCKCECFHRSAAEEMVDMLDFTVASPSSKNTPTVDKGNSIAYKDQSTAAIPIAATILNVPSTETVSGCNSVSVAPEEVPNIKHVLQNSFIVTTAMNDGHVHGYNV